MRPLSLLAVVCLAVAGVYGAAGPAASAQAAPSARGAGAAPASAPRMDFYVAPDGWDTWSGRLESPNAAHNDGPFATLEKARDTIRRLRAAGKVRGPVTVYLREGTYRLSKPFVLRPEDSGTAQAPVTYAAYPREEPVLSGGKPITGWRAGPGPLWSAPVPAAKAGKWYFRQLFVNGRRRPRARLPQEGAFPMAGTAVADWEDPLNKKAFRYRPGDVRNGLANPVDIEVVVLQHWMAAHLRLATVEEVTHTVTCTGPSWRPLMWSKGYYLDNVREGLTGLGQWYLDRPGGVLLYRPLGREDVANAEVVAPVIEQLVRLEGDPVAGRPVRYVTLRGLTLSHTQWNLPPEGFAHPQADIPLPAAIEAEGAHRCAIVACRFEHTGAWGLSLGRACQDNRVVGCTFEDIGAGGIRIGERENPADDRDEACRTLVSDNTLREGSVFALGSPAIWIGQSGGNRVCHNEVSGGWQWAVSVGWNWSYMPPNRSRDNIVEDNHLHHVGTGPLGAHSVVYALGVSPGTIIRRNRIHHSSGYAIALDASASGILVENNICHHMGQGGLHFNWYCLGNIVQNNIFAFGHDAQLTRYGDPPPGDDTNCNVVQRNLFYWKGGKLYNEEKWPNYRMVSDYNLYWDVDEQPVKFLTYPFREWQAKGLDQHSVIADPLFTDANNGDFLLQPASPALKLGFRAIDLKGVGPRKGSGTR